VWEEKLHEGLCKRWKERRENYEMQERREKYEMEETTKRREQCSNEDHNPNTEVTCQKKKNMQLYKELATGSLHKSNDTLLLPSIEVNVPESSDTNIGLLSSLTGINRVAVSPSDVLSQILFKFTFQYTLNLVL